MRLATFFSPLFFFCLTAPSYAATLPKGQINAARLALAKLRGTEELTRLREGITVRDALAALKQKSAADQKYWTSVERKHQLSPLETIRIKNLQPTADGWDFQVPGLAAPAQLTLQDAAKPTLALNGVSFDPEAPAATLAPLLKKALSPERSGWLHESGIILWNKLVPPAQANPVVILPALATLGMISVVQAIARYTAPPAPVVLEKYFQEAFATCAKEKTERKAIYDGSATAGLVGKLLGAGLVDFPARPGACETFAARVKAADHGVSAVGNATLACRAADNFLACAGDFKRKSVSLPRAREKAQPSMDPEGNASAD